MIKEYKCKNCNEILIKGFNVTRCKLHNTTKYCDKCVRIIQKQNVKKWQNKNPDRVRKYGDIHRIRRNIKEKSITNEMRNFCQENKIDKHKLSIEMRKELDFESMRKKIFEELHKNEGK